MVEVADIGLGSLAAEARVDVAGDRRRRGPPAGRPGAARPTSGRAPCRSWPARPGCTGPRGWSPAGPCGPAPATPGWGARRAAGGGLPPGEHVTYRLPADGLGRRGGAPGWTGCGPWSSVPASAPTWPAARGARIAGGPAARAGRAVPAVVDADGLRALGDLDTVAAVVKGRGGAAGPHPPRGRVRPPGRPASRGGPDRRRACRGRTRLGRCCLLKGLHRRWWPSPAAGSCSSTPGRPGWPPPAPATCCPGSSAPSWLGACPPWRRRPWPPTAHGRAAALGPAEGLVAVRPAGPDVPRGCPRVVAAGCRIGVRPEDWSLTAGHARSSGKLRPAWAEIDLGAIRHNAAGAGRGRRPRPGCAPWSRPAATATARSGWPGPLSRAEPPGWRWPWSRRGWSCGPRASPPRSCSSASPRPPPCPRWSRRAC